MVIVFTTDPEFAALIPPLAEEERAQLETNLVESGGAREPLVVWSGLLLDGHNRFEICKRRGLRFDVVKAPETIKSRDDAKLWIVYNQFGRRNLPTFVRAELALCAEELIAAKAKANQVARKGEQAGASRQKSDELPAVSTKHELAKLAGVSHDTIHKAKEVSQKAPEAIKQQLRRNETTINAAHSAIRAMEKMLEPKRQEVIAKIESGTEVKQAIAEVKLDEKRALAAELDAAPVPLPGGKYHVIAIDPPWKYDARAEDASHRGKNQYPDMTIEQLAALPVESLAEDDCVLWLWTTNAFMREAYTLLDAWGFTAKTILTWDKVNLGLGDYLRNVTEHCILAVRGRPVLTLTNQTTMLTEKRREHSRKPDAFYTLVESLCHGTKVEMFSRAPRDGWSAWGAETQKFEAA